MKHGCPRRQQSQNMAKISKSYILTLPQHQRHVMSVKCEEPIDELIVQVWLLYHHQNFKYYTLLAGRNYGQTDRQTDDPITRCPRWPFQAGGIKILISNIIFISKYLIFLRHRFQYFWVYFDIKEFNISIYLIYKNIVLVPKVLHIL